MKATLTREQLVAGVLAGLFGHLLIALGWYTFGMLIVVGLIVLVLGTLLTLLLGGQSPLDLLSDTADDVGGLVVGAIIVAVIIGAGVLFLGVVVSRGILKRGNVRRPLAVTIRAALIAAALDTILFAIAVNQALQTSDADRSGPFVRGALVLVIGTIIVGVLVWMWMTWAHRGLVGEPAAVAAPAAAAPVGELPGYSAAPPAQPTTGISPPPTVELSDGPPPSIPRASDPPAPGAPEAPSPPTAPETPPTQP